jgi:ABC-2 type transport system permease protein
VHYFTETWNGGTRSIWQNRSLVMKMRMPRELFPVAAMVVAAYHTYTQLLLLSLICIFVGWHITLSGIAAFLLGTAILVTFSLAMGLFFSALNVYFKDFQNIVQTLLQFLHFMVPMMYPFSRIWTASHDHAWLYQLYMANPVAEAVILMQKFFWWGVVPDHLKRGDFLRTQGKYLREFPPDLWLRAVVMLAVTSGLLLLAQRFFSRVEPRFPERM